MTRNPQQEAEANEFALELLMPTPLLRSYAEGLDLLDDNAIAKIANIFKISIPVLAFRLGQLSERKYDNRDKGTLDKTE